MAILVDPTLPANTEAEALGASRIRNVAAWLQQMFGAAGTAPVSFTLAPFVADPVTGLVTAQGNPVANLGVATKQYVDSSFLAVPTVFTSGSGTFTTLPSVPYYRVLMVGGSGGGAAGTFTVSTGGGGGSGGVMWCILVGGGAAYPYTVGVGGSAGIVGGGLGANGGAGGATAVGGLTVGQGLGGLVLNPWSGGGGGAIEGPLIANNALVIQAIVGNAGNAGGNGNGFGGLGFQSNGGTGGNSSVNPSQNGQVGNNGLVVFMPGI